LREIRNEFVEARATDQRQLLTALDRMEVQRVQDYRQLSGGLVRLARVTGSGFRQAEEQFNSLASYTPDSTPVTDLKENKP
jgi:outer membrane protein TolC